MWEDADYEAVVPRIRRERRSGYNANFAISLVDSRLRIPDTTFNSPINSKLNFNSPNNQNYYRASLMKTSIQISIVHYNLKIVLSQDRINGCRELITEYIARIKILRPSLSLSLARQVTTNLEQFLERRQSLFPLRVGRCLNALS